MAILTALVIDYTKEDALKVIAPRSVDFIFDTMGQAMAFLPLLTKTSGMVISISTTPSGTQLQEGSLMRTKDKAKLPVVVMSLLNGLDRYRKAWAWWYSVGYEYMFLDANATDLELIRQNVEDGKLLPVVGSRANFNNLEQVKEMCMTVYRGKGGLGKAVIDIIGEN